MAIKYGIKIALTLTTNLSKSLTPMKWYGWQMFIILVNDYNCTGKNVQRLTFCAVDLGLHLVACTINDACSLSLLESMTVYY